MATTWEAWRIQHSSPDFWHQNLRKSEGPLCFHECWRHGVQITQLKVRRSSFSQSTANSNVTSSSRCGMGFKSMDFLSRLTNRRSLKLQKCKSKPWRSRLQNTNAASVWISIMQAAMWEAWYVNMWGIKIASVLLYEEVPQVQETPPYCCGPGGRGRKNGSWIIKYIFLDSSVLCDF